MKARVDGHGQRRGQRRIKNLRLPVLQLRWILHHALLEQWRAQARTQSQDHTRDLGVSFDDHLFLEDLEGAFLVLLLLPPAKDFPAAARGARLRGLGATEQLFV